VRIAVLGGSFNPIHIGHLLLADSVLSSFSYDRVMLVPAFQSPLKDESKGASPRDRLDMILAAIAADPRFGLDDCELKREGLSYTIDTVQDLVRRYRPRGRLGLILGDDLAANFHRWKQAGELAALTDIIVGHRTSKEELPFPYAHKRLLNPVIEISSASIREKILKREGWEYFVPPGVRYIIQDRGLYRTEEHGAQASAPEGQTPHPVPCPAPCSTPCSAPCPWTRPAGGRSEESAVFSGREQEGLRGAASRIEAELGKLVNFRRFIHSRNTALMAWDLARAYGLDPDKAYLAGIGHDICKSFSLEDVKSMARRDGKGLSRMEKKNPALLHGRAGAVYLKERCRVTDSGILEAVALHTTGAEDMGPLAMLIYIADKLEWSRENAAALRRVLDSPPLPELDELFAAVLADNVSFLESRKMSISGSTRRLLELMGKKGKK
jgi:nicotinate-nucleotide adenylyltransferase